jgi:serine/threonine protein kinase
MKKVKAGKFTFAEACWSNISDKAKDLITKLLTYDYEARPSASDCL